MKKKTKRVSRKSTSASPLPVNLFIAARESPKSTIVNKKKKPVGYSPASPLFGLKASSLVENGGEDHRKLSSVADLKEFAASRLDDIKRNLIERSQTEILKDVEASHSRLHKRFKACEKAADEVERDYKMSDEWINEKHEAIKASYDELMEAQVSASRAFKTTIEGLSKSLSKRVDDLRSHYGTSET